MCCQLARFAIGVLMSTARACDSCMFAVAESIERDEKEKKATQTV